MAPLLFIHLDLRLWHFKYKGREIKRPVVAVAGISNHMLSVHDAPASSQLLSR